LNSTVTKRDGLIPNVDFYGKDDTWPTSERLHSEPLVDRSAHHNWVIRPHRHSNQLQIFLLLEGSGVAQLDSVRHELAAPGVIIIPERCVHEFEWSSDSRGYVLSIASSLLAELKSRSSRFADVFARADFYPLEADTTLAATAGRIHREYEEDRPLRELALETHLAEMAIGLARAARLRVETRSRSGPGRRHFRRFLDMLETHHKVQWTVGRYAGALGISAPHLNAICKRYGGRSALRIIHERVMLAARRGLAYTDVSVAGIARNLGFADPAYFTRFFRRSEGLTPSEFRRQTGTQAASGR
jgi:AraC family transcriptional activator of pobA